MSDVDIVSEKLSDIADYDTSFEQYAQAAIDTYLDILIERAISEGSNTHQTREATRARWAVEWLKQQKGER